MVFLSLSECTLGVIKVKEKDACPAKTYAAAIEEILMSIFFVHAYLFSPFLNHPSIVCKPEGFVTSNTVQWGMVLEFARYSHDRL